MGGKLNGLRLKIYVLLNLDAPVFKRFLRKEIFCKSLNGIKFFIGILSAALQDVSHLKAIFSYLIRNSVYYAEFRWNITVLTIDSDQEERLFSVRDLHIIGFQEVLGYGHLFPLGIHELIS